MTLSKEKFEHILAYAKQQQKLGVHHCNILPDDMVAIMEMATGKLERRERDKQEPVYQVQYGQQWRDVSRERYNDHVEHGSQVRIVYAAPPAPVVPEAIENAIEYIKSIAFHIDENDYHGQHIAHFMQQAIMWLEGDACRAAMHSSTISNSADIAIDEASHVTAPIVPDANYQQLSELYHSQEKRLFKIAQRIKGPSFDKYAYSPSQAIDVLEVAIFGESNDGGAAALNQTHVKQPASNSPVIPDDVRRMDWLVSKKVNVREPLVYGSHNIFWSQAITDDQDEHHATALREQIDAAIMAEESAAPKQESE